MGSRALNTLEVSTVHVVSHVLFVLSRMYRTVHYCTALELTSV